MILPSKHVPIDRSLLGVGAKILKKLDTPQTVAAIWDAMRNNQNHDADSFVLSYSWFILALNLLHLLGLVDLEKGLIQKATH